MSTNYKNTNKFLEGLNLNDRGFDEIMNSLRKKNLTEREASIKAISMLIEPKLDFGKYRNKSEVKDEVLEMISTLIESDGIKNLKEAQSYLDKWLDGYEIMYE